MYFYTLCFFLSISRLVSIFFSNVFLSLKKIYKSIKIIRKIFESVIFSKINACERFTLNDLINFSLENKKWACNLLTLKDTYNN